MERSVVVLIFKNTGEVQNCSTYRGIKLISHTVNIWEQVVEARLRQEVTISPQQLWLHAEKENYSCDFCFGIADGEV